MHVTQPTVATEGCLALGWFCLQLVWAHDINPVRINAVGMAAMEGHVDAHVQHALCNLATDEIDAGAPPMCGFIWHRGTKEVAPGGIRRLQQGIMHP